MALLKRLDRLLVATDAHVVANEVSAEDFGERARVDGPPILRSVVLHANVALLGDAVDGADLGDQIGHLLVPAAVAFLHLLEDVDAHADLD